MLPSVACVLECTCGPEIVLSICFLFPFFIKRLFGLECCGFFTLIEGAFSYHGMGRIWGKGGLSGTSERLFDVFSSFHLEMLWGVRSLPPAKIGYKS